MKTHYMVPCVGSKSEAGWNGMEKQAEVEKQQQQANSNAVKKSKNLNYNPLTII